MAEATALRNNALPYPIYAAPFTIVIPILDADGDLVTGAAGLDSELSKNGDTFADCTNEATEIATSSGMYYLSLTGTELTTDVAAVIVKTSTTGAKTTPVVLYPRKLVTFASGTATAGAASTITLQAGSAAIDDAYNGMVILTTGGTGPNQCRLITDYVGSTRVATVAVAWATNPSSDTTYNILLPDVIQMQPGNVINWASAAAPAMTGDAYARLGAPAGASVSADIASIKTDTGTTIPGRLPSALVSGKIDASVGAYQAGQTPLQPTVAGRTLDVSAGGEAGLDWDNVGSPTTAVNLSGTTISTSQAVASVSGAVGSVSGAVGSVTGAVGSVTGNVGGSVASVTGAVGSVTGNVGGNVTGSVASVTGNVGGNVTGSVGSLATQAKTDVAAAVAAYAYEGSETVKTLLRLIRAKLVGKASGGATASIVYRDAADAKDRITETVDSSGNRSAVSVDGTD